MSIYTWTKRWAGLGVKAGGQLIAAGLESTGAHMWNLGNLETFDLRILNARYGPGLGGSGGAVLVLAMGIVEPYELHGQSLSDWGFNVAVTEKLINKSVMNSLVFSRRLLEIYDRFEDYHGRAFVKNALKDAAALQSLRQGFHWIFAGLEVSKMKGVVVIDIPFGGAGLELSAFITRGHMAVSNSSDMDLADSN